MPVELVDRESVTPVSVSRGQPKLPWKALTIGLMLSVAVSLLVSYAELVTKLILVGSQQMPPGVIAVFFLLALVNSGIRRLGRRLELSSPEMAIIYCMILVSGMVSARGVVEKLLPVLVAPNYYAGSWNKWTQLFFPHIKRWLVPFDPAGGARQQVAVDYYEALRSGRIPWDQWVAPLLAWGLLSIVVLFAFLCMATILRRQWVENEKLTFPLAHLPVELMSEGKGHSLLASKPLRIGFLVPVVFYTLSGLHNWFPNIPMISVSGPLIRAALPTPWNELFSLSVYFSFAAAGLCFLLPSQILLSLWSFYLLSKVQHAVAVYLGYTIDYMPLYPCSTMIGYQVMGAYFVLVGFLLYSARLHLKEVFCAAFCGRQADDSQELMPYGFALKGLLVSFLLAIGWCIAAGMSVWVAVLVFGVFFFVVVVIMARSTAEAGMFMTETSFRPVDLYRMVMPVSTLGLGNISVMALLDGALLRDQRGLLLTGFLDGLKISDGARVDRRALLPAFIIAALLSMVAGSLLQIWLPYTHGALNLYPYITQANPTWALTDYQRHFEGAPGVNQSHVLFFGVGALVTVVLSYMHRSFYWWPLHPLGYALSGSWTMVVMWFPCLLVWMLKSAVLRYGGMRLYASVRPAFIGLILGEFVVAATWTLVAALTGLPTPEFAWP